MLLLIAVLVKAVKKNRKFHRNIDFLHTCVIQANRPSKFQKTKNFAGNSRQPRNTRESFKRSVVRPERPGCGCRIVGLSDQVVQVLVPGLGLEEPSLQED